MPCSRTFSGLVLLVMHVDGNATRIHLFLFLSVKLLRQLKYQRQEHPYWKEIKRSLFSPALLLSVWFLSGFVQVDLQYCCARISHELVVLTLAQNSLESMNKISFRQRIYLPTTAISIALILFPPSLKISNTCLYHFWWHCRLHALMAE